MRVASILLFVLPALTALAQNTTTSYTYDLNGRRVPNGEEVATKSDGTATRTEKTVSVNGRTVPQESVEERVLQSGANHTVVERLVKKYNPDGQPGPPEKVLIDTETNPDGTKTTQTSVYRGDINGAMRLAEQTTTERSQQGQTVDTNSVVARPSINGGLATVEKRQTVEQLRPDGMHQSTEVYRKDDNGDFYEALRQVTDQETKNGTVTANTAVYEPGAGGQMQLSSQNVQTTTREANGAEHVQVDIYGHNVPGTVRDPNAKLELQEQQLIDRSPGAGNKVVETLSVRRPTISDPTTLGSARKLSEAVCTGKCGDSPAQP
ncbi:MAG: hypothetical protein ACRD9L_15915 [Bryobacteraceae bacterium]